MEKRAFVLLGFILLIGTIVFCINPASAGFSLKVTGSINDYASDIWLKTNTNANLGFDGYDMPVRTPPSNYSQFYSSITGYSLAVDSWPFASSRNLDLVYDVSEAQTGDLIFSWNRGAFGSGYSATFTDYGSDASRTTPLGNANMNSLSSYSRNISGESTIYIRIAIEEVEGAEEEVSGGGGVPTGAPGEGIEIDSKIMNVYIALGEVKTRKINLNNKGNNLIPTTLSIHGLQDYLLIKDNSFDLAPGERRNVDVRVVAPEEPGIYTGKIIVRGLRPQEILVTLNVNTEEVLFDASVVIPEQFKRILEGERLQAQTTLIPMGEDIRMDVTLNYLIKDFEGRTFLTESETMLITEQESFMRRFSTQNLPAGDYVLGLELTYPNGMATSSSHFEVSERELPVLVDYRFVLMLLGVGIIILLIAIILISRKYKKIKKHK